MNHRFLISVLTDDFLSHDLRLTAANLRKERDPEKRTEALDAIDTEAVTPVSYTHLDVYKRQVPDKTEKPVYHRPGCFKCRSKVLCTQAL